MAFPLEDVKRRLLEYGTDDASNCDDLIAALAEIESLNHDRANDRARIGALQFSIDLLKDSLQQALNQRGILCSYALNGGDRSDKQHRMYCPRCKAEDRIGEGWYINPDTALP